MNLDPFPFILPIEQVAAINGIDVFDLWREVQPGDVCFGGIIADQGPRSPLYDHELAAEFDYDPAKELDVAR